MADTTALRQENLELIRRIAFLEQDEPVTAAEIKAELKEAKRALDHAAAQKSEALDLVFALVDKDTLRRRVARIDQ
jgi:hypothetical protein